MRTRLVSKLAAAACIAAMAMAAATPASAEEATRISGVAYFADASECDWAAVGADFALILTGDLEGCLFVYVDNSYFTPSGTYVESGHELFVGADGTFETTYRFEAKYEDPDAFPEGEIFGRCQHPIADGSGTGAFAGVAGRIDFKDNVETGEFFYRGSLQFPE